MSSNQANVFRLDRQVAVVTGGAGGIGQVCAVALASAGAQVIVGDLVPHRQDVAESDGSSILSVVVDVSDETSVAHMVKEVEGRFGRLDILVNNAALLEGATRRPFHELSVGEWDRMMAVNARGTFLCARAAYPLMARLGQGRIINIASSLVFKGRSLSAAYIASKGAVIALTRALARELGPSGITVNAVAPGLTRTEAMMAQAGFDDRERAVVAGRSIRRAQYPIDLAGAVVFLASPASAFVTGQTLVVDGGEVMH